MGISTKPAEGLKAWVNFNGVGTVAIRSSYNVSSITDVAAGTFDVNYETPFSAAEQATIASCGRNGGSGGYVCSVDDGQAINVGECRITTFNLAGNSQDSASISVHVAGVL